MSSVDGFASESPPATDRPDLKSPELLLLDAMEACKISVEAAKSPFARGSKMMLERQLKDPSSSIPAIPREIHRGSSEELVLRDDALVLTSHTGITMTLDARYHRRLFNELHWFCDEVRRRTQHFSMTILDGLQVDIRKVSDTHFTFSWKLRYVIQSHG